MVLVCYGIMISFLQNLFQEKYIVDDRSPLVTFSLPLVDNEKTFGLFVPTVEPWIQLSLFLIIQLLIQTIFAAVIYSFIVQRRGTVEAYLFGWGFVIPTSCYIPFVLLEVLDIQNKVITLSASTLMTCIVFRCVEAMYNTSPEVVESGLRNYVAYCSSPIPFLWDPKTKSRKKPTLSRVSTILLEITFYFTCASLLLSILIYCDFRPIGPSVNFDQLKLSLDLLSPAHVGNAYFHILLLYFTLGTGFNLTAFNEMVKGCDSHKIFDSPLLLSRSTTEFWTKRWNAMTQRLLKTGVFQPLRQYFSTRISILLTFIVSGLYHEYVWMCIFYNSNRRYDENGSCQACYEHKFGRVTCFFVFTGVTMLLERPLGKLFPFQWMSKNLPRPMISHLLLSIYLPLTFWYYGEWIEGGYFHDFSICLWLIRPI